MRLCFIGNSHTGMLVQALRESAPQGVEATFFAHPGRGPEGVRLRNGQLRATTREMKRSLARLGMPDVVDVAAQDAFVLVGMTATVFSLLPMLQTHRVFGWSADVADVERALVSETALEAEVAQVIATGLAVEFITKIRRVSAAPILLVAQPAPSEEAVGGKARHVGLRRILRRGQGAAVQALLARAHARALSGVTVLAQPEETLVHGYLSAARYMRGAGRLNPGGRQPEDDILHANVEYGALVLDQVLSAARKSLAESMANPV
ncbi:MAG: hypothetical protein KDK24_19190 [Pseudooceanicola sp.]|nr:hypothetical protein [Pseudooceanicola sp.]